MSVNRTMLQSTLLRLLADRDVDSRLGRGRDYFAEAAKAKFPKDQRPTSQEIMSTVWSVIGQGLAYIDYSQPAPENWKLYLTESGEAAVRDEVINPDNSGEYLEQLQTAIPQASETVLQYTREAVIAYNARCYLASAVMLGVASEAAFLEMARSFGNWLPFAQGQKFLGLIENPRTNYVAKFDEFRKRIEPVRSQLSDELADGMSLTLDSVLDLLRVYRNDAGHPTGKKIARDDAFINLQMFARYLQKLYALKDYLDSNRPIP